jgi:hypothetical protein
MSRFLFAMLIWSPFYILPTAALSLGARFFFSRKPRPPLVLEDWLLFLVPWFMWFGFLYLNGDQKSLANLAEAYALIFAAILGYSLRLRFGPRHGPRRVARAVLVTVCLIGVALAYFVPALPE